MSTANRSGFCYLPDEASVWTAIGEHMLQYCCRSSDIRTACTVGDHWGSARPVSGFESPMNRVMSMSSVLPTLMGMIYKFYWPLQLSSLCTQEVPSCPISINQNSIQVRESDLEIAFFIRILSIHSVLSQHYWPNTIEPSAKENLKQSSLHSTASPSVGDFINLDQLIETVIRLVKCNFEPLQIAAARAPNLEGLIIRH